MKKILALLLVLMLSCACVCAVAEDINAYYFDPESVAGVEGEFAALEEYALQFFLPSHFVSFEPSEADVARGVIAVLGAEDGSIAMSISYVGVADAEGNLITNLNDLYDFYAAQGVETMELAYFNDLPALYYLLSEPDINENLLFMNADHCVLGFNVLTNGEPDQLSLGHAILSSIMVVE